MTDELITIERQLAHHRAHCANCYDVMGGKALCAQAIELMRGLVPRPEECPVCHREQDHSFTCSNCRRLADLDREQMRGAA